MVTLLIDMLLFHPEKPEQKLLQLTIPVPGETARRLMDAQHGRYTIYEQSTICGIAELVGGLHGLRATVLRVAEAEQ